MVNFCLLPCYTEFCLLPDKGRVLSKSLLGVVKNMNTEAESKFVITNPGPRPPYYKVADYLWGEGANIDSDGNSTNPEDTNWTEISICFRNKETPYVHVDPITENPLILEVRSNSYELAKKAAEFIAKSTGGILESTNA